MTTPHSIKSAFAPLVTALVLAAAITAAQAGTDTWSATPAGANWNSTDWTGGNAPPLAGDALVFGSSTQATLNNNFPALTAFDSLTFSGGTAFLFTGNSVLLSGSSATNTIGVLNNSGVTQTFGSLPLMLDHGYYTFSSPSGGTVALNGGLTLATGGVAYFDANATSTSLTSDATTGLINGLEGAAMIYDGNVTPTGLATISSGVITSYLGYTPVAAGAIANGNNLNLTASGAAAAYTANNNTVNTLSVAQVGNTGGTATTTLTTTGSLTLGANGGVYLLGNTIGNKACLNLAGGTITAGTNGPASLLFAVNGSTTGNQVAVNSKITNNAGGGPVTVTTTGPGSLFFAVANSYTGGTYVNQGQLQGNNIGAFGTGPIYIASDAGLLLNSAGTWANNLFLSSGSGAPIAGTGAAGGAGSLEFNNNDVFTGTMTLQGPAVTNTPGDRITGNVTGGTLTISGQITGTGTLEFFGYHTYTVTLANASTVNTNNWQGGMIIGGKPGVAVNVDVKMGATNQIPSGPNAGNITFIPATSAVYSRLDLNGFNQTVNGLVAISANSTAEAQLDNFGTTSCTLTFGANDATATFNGIVADGASVAKSLGLVKIGAGTQTFNNALNHYGNTTISAGTIALGGAAAIPNTPLIALAANATLDASAVGSFTVVSNHTLAGLGTVVGAVTANGILNPFLITVGTLTNNGSLTLGGGGAYVWDINNASGNAGTDSGWGLIDVTNGSVVIAATAANPFTVKITSLTAGDVAGNAVNFNANATKSWIILQSPYPISGFDSTLFKLDATAFSNPVGSGGFAIGLSPDQTSLVLTFSAVSTITTPLVNLTNNVGTIAVFTVVAGGAANPLTFQWFENGSPLSDGGFSLGGAMVGITNNTAAKSSTLTLTGVQDGDAGAAITVNVTNTVGAGGSSTATLTIIDPPANPVLNPTPLTTVSAGGVTTLAATASGTGPFTYYWIRNGVALTNGGLFSGANSGTLSVDVSTGDLGSYSVIISNAAGSVTSSPIVLGPITSVPGQIIYEPFSSYVAQTYPPPGADTWEGVTNLFNQITDEHAWWFHSSGSGVKMIIQNNDMNDGNNNINGGSYPWPGLAGNSPNCMYWTESLNSHLEFQQEGFAPGTTIYFSCILNCETLGAANGVQDVLAGFVTANDGTAFNLKVCSQISDFASGQYQLGIAKANGRTGAQGVDANTAWVNAAVTNQSDILIVAAYTVVSGGTTATDDTVSLWVNPDPSTFYAATPPAPTVGPLNFGVANSSIRDFAVHSTVAPASHRLADLRIGTTWASVTPPSAPTLSVGNVYAPAGTTAVFSSQNAGNPVVTYTWQFNGGPVLTDNGHYSGTATDTLVISNVQPADLGTYTVNGVNVDPLTSANLNGSASAILSSQPPKLSVAYSTPNVIVSWPTNWTGFILEQSAGLQPTSWMTNSLAPYPVSGANNAVTNAAASAEFYRLVHY